MNEGKSMLDAFVELLFTFSSIFMFMYRELRCKFSFLYSILIKVQKVGGKDVNFSIEF